MPQSITPCRIGVVVSWESDIAHLNRLLDDSWHIENISENDLGYLVAPLHSLAGLERGKGTLITRRGDDGDDEKAIMLMLTEGGGARHQQFLSSNLNNGILDLVAIHAESSARFSGWEVVLTLRLNSRRALLLLEQ
ncbi:MAG: hypothetical protein ABIQ57_17835 [Candidatus Kapaibacterium sp.]